MKRPVYPQWLKERLAEPAFNAWATAFWSLDIKALHDKAKADAAHWTDASIPYVLDGEDRE